MSPIVLIPMPIEHTPKIRFISVLNFGLNLCPTNAPAIPPKRTEQALIITPIGIFYSSLISTYLVTSILDQHP